MKFVATRYDNFFSPLSFVAVFGFRSRIFIWCGSGTDFSPWCGSGSRSLLPNKGSNPWKGARTGSYYKHFGLSSAKLMRIRIRIWILILIRCGSGCGSWLPKWCGSGSTTLRSTGTSGGGGGRGLGALGARLNGCGMVLGFRSMGAPYLNLGRVSPTPWACNAGMLVSSNFFLNFQSSDKGVV